MSAPVPWPGRSALVLGAGGFLGRWVARELARAGAHVTHVVRDGDAFERDRAAWALAGPALVADLAQAGEAAGCVARARPDVVFNLAGYGVDRSERDEDTFEALNARLPAELGEAVRGLAGDGVRLVHTGSALEYGVLRTDLSETDEPRPTTPYGRSKLAGTRAVLASAGAHGHRAVVARLFTVFGPGEHAGRLLPSLRAGRDAGGDVALSEGLQTRDFTYVEDVAQGLLRLAALPPEALPGPALVNLASGRLTSVRDFCLAAGRALGIPLERLRFGALGGRSDDMAHLPVNVARLRALLDWTPSTPIEEAVRHAERFQLRLERG